MNVNNDTTPATPRRRFLFGGLLFVAVALAAGLAALLVNISDRKHEAKNPTVRVVELTDETDDPAVWGKNFPVEYDLYRKTAEMAPTKYGGEKKMVHDPTAEDPRSFVSQSKVDEDPGLKAIWAGYAFAADFREERGHAYMLDDQTYTKRQIVVKQPGTCMNCHASVYVPHKKLGGGDLVKGFELMNQMSYVEARKLVQHPVTCIDCHEPKTMALRVTRAGFLEGIRAFKASQGVKDFDPNTMASRNEMRAYVCGQCHVEYYFKGPEKRLVFPWSKGLDADSIASYYDEIAFKDWVHKESGAPALKAQHPEFELWSLGIHARSGVTCADCHMPYLRVGGQKVSDHQVRSPLLNLNRACQSCHKWSETELKGRVEEIQERFHKQRNQAFDAVIALINDIKKAKEAGKSDKELETARFLQRRAQFLLDFVEAENSTGFHAPQEAQRVLGSSLDLARQGQVALRDPAFKPTIAVVSFPAAPAAPAAPPAPSKAAAPATPGVVPASLAK
jgi:nitrite reductase (cytochrome c-552)